MAEIVRNAVGDGPGTHALVIGVSQYPFLDGDGASAQGRAYRLRHLSGAARSASNIAAWLLSSYRNPDAPLATIQILLSPGPGEAVHEEVDTLDGVEPATLASAATALTSFRKRLKEHRDGVGFVYVAGHGVQLTKRGAILLLADFADPESRSDLERSLDLVGEQEGCRGNAFASRQFWFVDACRGRPATTNMFEHLTPPAVPDQPLGGVATSAIVLAAASREAAFSEIGGTTLFSRALLQGLQGAAAVGPTTGCGDWHVSISQLSGHLTRETRRLAEAGNESQTVDPVVQGVDAPLHRFPAPPDVDVQLDLEPADAQPAPEASLLFNGKTERVPPTRDWPVRSSVPAGLYLLQVAADPPWKSVSQPVHVLPPGFHESVTVS